MTAEKQHVPVSVAVLALVEAFIAFIALYFAVCVRFQTPFSHIQLLEAELGPLWPRALLFSLIVVISLMSFGLYGPRRPPQLSGVLVRVVAALLVASIVVAALFYLVPSLQLWRGVEAIAVIVTGCGVLLSRLVFALVGPAPALEGTMLRVPKLTDYELETAAQACRALASTEREVAGRIADPGMRAAVQRRADVAAGLTERFERARNRALT